MGTRADKFLVAIFAAAFLVFSSGAPAYSQEKSRGAGRGDTSSYAPELWPPERTTPGLYFIDAHSQMDHNVDEERVISLMDRGGVYRTLLSVHLRRDWSDIVNFAGRFPERIVPAVRIKGPGYQHGPPESYYSRLAGQLGSDAFKAMAEVLVFHDSGGGKFQSTKTSFDDRQVRAAFDAARKRGWPFIIHIEFKLLSSGDKERYLIDLARFLRANPDHPFVMIHMGVLEEPDVRRLLDAHGNLYFMTSQTDPLSHSARKPFIDMFGGGKLKREWRQLMIGRPDRFVFALDNVFSVAWMPGIYLPRMELWWKALAEFPDEAAHAIAHGNAERLWKLAPRPDGHGMTPPWIAVKELGTVTGYSANVEN